MPFIIDQKLCVGCGACIGNCLNRAIIRRGNQVLITDMCCDCGICKHYCGMDAISMGPTKAELNNITLGKALKEKLALTRDIVAMKFADKVPEGVVEEEGLNFWCHICGDIFQGQGSPLYFTAKNSTCGGSLALGLGARSIDRDSFNAMVEITTGQGGYFASQDLFTKGRLLFPRFPKVYGGLILGSLARMNMPDMVLFPLNGKQMCMLSTAYAFDTGEVMTGNAGAGTCLWMVTIPFLENKPVFSCGDNGGRLHMQLRDEEILVCMPYRLVPGIVKNLDKTIFATE
ncbi:MAG: DUF169 domain-containing protein [Proteobacteria bacterium]|nr:DUF169 domain-containing protein [Pseudomonadota bacterium]